MSQERSNGSAMIVIERKIGAQLNIYDDIIKEFAETKAETIVSPISNQIRQIVLSGILFF